MKERRMSYIPNYVDTTVYRPVVKKNDERIKVLFPRRLSSERGYWLTSRAVVPIMKKYPHVDIDFVGFIHGDKIADDIKRLISLFPNRIHHYVVEPDEMIRFYQKADISLIPTEYSEGTSLSCLEAQVCGNTVIATNNRRIAEFNYRRV